MSDGMTDAYRQKDILDEWESALKGCYTLADAYNKGAKDMKDCYFKLIEESKSLRELKKKLGL